MSVRKNTLFNVTYRLISTLLPLATTPYLSRVVGRAGVGVYSYAWAISEMFVMFAMLGLEQYGTRSIAEVREDRKSLDRVFSQIYRMQLMSAGVMLLLWLGYSFFIAGQERMISIHLTMMSISCLVNLDWCLMGLDDFKSIAIRNTVIKLTATATVFLLVHKPEDMWIYALVWSGATMLGCLLCWTALRGRVSMISVPLKDSLKRLKPCSVLLVSVIAIKIYRSMDKVMLGAMAGMAENGLYDYAEKIIYCLSGFIYAIGIVLLPRSSSMLAQGRIDQVKQQMDKTMQVLMCMTCAFAFGILAVSKDFAVLFFGESFAYSGVLMIPLGFTLIIIAFANVMRMQWILPKKLDRIYLTSVISGAVVNLIVNMIMIPRMASMGAVVGTIFAETTVPIVQFIYLRRELPYLQYLKHVLVYCIIGGIMSVLTMMIGRHLPTQTWPGIILQCVAGMVIYGVLCLAWWKLSGDKVMASVFKRNKR